MISFEDLEDISELSIKDKEAKEIKDKRFFVEIFRKKAFANGQEVVTVHDKWEQRKVFQNKHHPSSTDRVLRYVLDHYGKLKCEVKEKDYRTYNATEE